MMQRWDPVAEDRPFTTRTSWLLPLRRDGTPAILKIALEEEEKRGGRLMVWFDGKGAAPVLAHDQDGLLLERAMGPGTLAELARTGRDDEACRIICRTIGVLHEARAEPPPPLMPLAWWFGELGPAAARHGGVLARAASTTRELLASQEEVVPLHGDIHHGNVLDFGGRGWLAIDPKGLIGDRCFDYANLFCNPEHEIATQPARFARRVEIVEAWAGLDRARLLRWILAWAGLSAAWLLKDGDCARTPLRVAELAAAEIDRHGN